MTFEELHQPLFREHGSIYFANGNRPPKEFNYAFCEVCFPLHFLLSLLQSLDSLFHASFIEVKPRRVKGHSLLAPGLNLYKGRVQGLDYSSLSRFLVIASSAYVHWCPGLRQLTLYYTLLLTLRTLIPAQIWLLVTHSHRRKQTHSRVNSLI